MIIDRFKTKEVKITDSFGRDLYEGDSFLLIRSQYHGDFSDILLCKMIGLSPTGLITYKVALILKNDGRTKYKESQRKYNIDIDASSILIIKQSGDDISKFYI